MRSMCYIMYLDIIMIMNTLGHKINTLDVKWNNKARVENVYKTNQNQNQNMPNGACLFLANYADFY